MINLQLILEALLITTALSMDALVSGFAYGANKIKIPFVSVIIINVICSAVLGVSLFLGSFIGRFIPKEITLTVCVVILIFLGLIKIFDSYIKNLIKRKKGVKKELKFSLFSLNFILNVFANPEDADTNRNKVLSPKEAFVLALALSLDGLTIGLGTGMASESALSYIIIIAFSLVVDMIFLIAGTFVGNKIAQKFSLNLSWLSGIILIGLALIKIFL